MNIEEFIMLFKKIHEASGAFLWVLFLLSLGLFFMLLNKAFFIFFNVQPHNKYNNFFLIKQYDGLIHACLGVAPLLGL